MPGSPVPNNDNLLVPFLNNFVNKLNDHAATFGIAPAEMTVLLNERDMLVYLIDTRLPMAKATVSATVEFKNLLKEGEPSAALPSPLPGTVALPSYPTAVPPLKPGIIKRLRKLVQTIKNHPNYTVAIGEELGILTGEGGGAAEAPELILLTDTAGNVSIGWNKEDWTGVKVQGRTPGGAWGDLGTDLFSPWVDTRPLTVPGTPETREYRMFYLDGDELQPTPSDVLVVTVKPA